jgi:alkaline phosphatase
MALGVKNTFLNLPVLNNQKVSVNKLSALIRDLRREKGNAAEWDDIVTLLKNNLGFWDGVKISSDDEKKLQDCYAATFFEDEVPQVETLYAKDDPLAVLAVGIINQIAQVGWTSNSHTAASVPVFAIGQGAENFAGRMDNTDIKKRIEKLMK